MINRDDRRFHPWIPEITNMLRGCGNRCILTLGGKIAGDLIGHVGKSSGVHCYSAGSAAIRRLVSDQLA